MPVELRNTRTMGKFAVVVAAPSRLRPNARCDTEDGLPSRETLARSEGEWVAAQPTVTRCGLCPGRPVVCDGSFAEGRAAMAVHLADRHLQTLTQQHRKRQKYRRVGAPVKAPGPTGAPAVSRRLQPAVVAVGPGKSRPPWRTWSEEQILACIRSWAAERGRPPTARNWRRAATDHPSSATVSRQFGGWANAIWVAGFPRPRWGQHQRHTLSDGSA